ncbi:leucokinins-like [Anopheles coustani]|uniref:leucokinins-like n=1 Tax=Anopheles coustani TaxID=139045 RepID=UPI002659CE12|nr:leucokinins-like [Anopheles coustani]
MAMFCLLLAVAAFVLTGGPSLCRCDRPHLSPGRAFYRSDPLAGNGFEESVWNSIGHEAESVVAHGEGAKVIPVTKLTLPSTVPWQRAVMSARELIVLESLLNRYRKYMVDEFSRYDDACSVLYDDDEAVAVDSYNDSVEISLGQAVAGRLDDTSGSGGEKTSNTLRKDDSMKLSHPLKDYCSRSARQFYHCLIEDVSDQQLLGIIHEYLQTICTRDPRASSNVLQKRDTPRYVSKQKFHSWGGKRSNDPAFYPWGGKRTAVRPHKQPKVVIRNPFHSWGGKRSDVGAASDVSA